MSQNNTDFTIKFSADSAKFSKDVDYAKNMLRGYTKEARAANDATGGFGKSLEAGADKTKAFGLGVLRVAGGVAAAFGAAAAATSLLITKQAAHGRELEKMAVVANLTVKEIQSLSYASKQYGISGEKMSDILKDVNDKLGDFSATGGGEFKDFFEQVAPKVGLTIQELQRMAGPEALIAIKSAMDAANVPMQQQIFYLESIANDASTLIPLLDDQGTKLKQLRKQYDDLNVSMSEYDIEQLKQMDQELQNTGLKLERSFTIAVLGARDQINWLSDYIGKSVTWWGELFDKWTEKPRTENGLLNKLGDLRSEAKQTKNILKTARIELSSLEATQKKAEGDLAAEAHLANAGWDKRIKSGQKKVGELSDKLKQIENDITKYQTQYEDDALGFNRNPANNSKQPELPKPEPIPVDSAIESQGKSKLASLDVQYASEFEKLQLSHQDRLNEIENLQLSEREIKERGYQSLADLKMDYVNRESEFNTEQEEAYFERLDENMQRELGVFSQKEDEKTRKAALAAKQRADTEKRLEQQVLSMKAGLASQALGLIASTAQEGSALQKAAFIAQKGMAIAQIIMSGEVAAAAALELPPIGLGPTAGAAQAATIRTMSRISAGLVAAQTIAGMAHSGISKIPDEGTWLLNKGERVYTNDSAKQLDQMYGAVMSQAQKRYAANDPSQRYANQLSNNNQNTGGLPVTVVINEAPAGSHVESVDDEKKVISIMMKDASSSGQYFGYLSKKLGAKSGGYK